MLSSKLHELLSNTCTNVCACSYIERLALLNGCDEWQRCSSAERRIRRGAESPSVAATEPSIGGVYTCLVGLRDGEYLFTAEPWPRLDPAGGRNACPLESAIAHI